MERGTTLLEMLVALAVAGVILITFLYATTQLDKLGIDVTREDDVDSLRFLISRSLDCKETMEPAGSPAPECGTTVDDGKGCESKPGIVVMGRAGDSLRKLIAADGTRTGKFQLRSCCPNGDVMIEVKPGPKANWQPLLSTAAACLKRGAGKLPKRVVVRGDLTPFYAPAPGVVCPGNFHNVPSLSHEETHLYYYDGVAACPKGYRLVSGGADCRFMGLLPAFPDRSGLAESHPRLKSSPTGRVEDATQWFASCCGRYDNPIPHTQRVYAICEEKP